MAADEKEADLNKKASADARDLALAPLLGRDITDEEGAYLKENLLAAVFSPAEAITAGVVAVNKPTEKAAASAYEASSLSSSSPLSL